MRFGKPIICAAVLAMLSSIAAVVPAAANSPRASRSTSKTYVVLYKSSSISSSAALAVTKAGGTIVASYPQIGVVIASSSRSTFRTTLLKNKTIAGAAATSAYATSLDIDNATDASATPLPDSGTATDTDSLSGLQWDMVQMHTPEAHAITGGSPSAVSYTHLTLPTIYSV